METFKLEQDQTEVVYSHINAKGSVFLRVSNEEGPAEVRLWWTKGPLGKNKHLGTHSGDITIDIEGFLWGRLKAQAFHSSVVVQVSDDPNVKHNFPTITF